MLQQEMQHIHFYLPAKTQKQNTLSCIAELNTELNINA